MKNDNDFLSILTDINIEVLEDIPEAGWIDTGSYILNALLSGSIYGGLPSNRCTMLAGSPSAGKCARGTETIEIYASPETIKKIKTKLNLE